MSDEIVFTGIGCEDVSQVVYDFNSKITLNNISFAYSGNNELTLDNVSFSIDKGSSTAIIGTSGAGKSTLVDILLGLLAPSEGKIEVDGVDIQKNVKEWNRLIGYVGQEIFLIDDSLRRNIALGIRDEDIDDDRVWDAIKQAQLTELVNSLPEGLDTVLGERGSRLSGGERQRIGIARALYSNPEVLILDEATSALDEANQHLIMNTIQELRNSKTIVMITHRVNTLEFCDKIIEIVDGKAQIFPESCTRQTS